MEPCTNYYRAGGDTARLRLRRISAYRQLAEPPMTKSSPKSETPPRGLTPPPRDLGVQRTAKCGRCGTKQLLTIPPDWDRRAFVQTYCTKCSYRFLLPTRRLLLWRNLALVAFPLCVWFVIRTIMQAS